MLQQYPARAERNDNTCLCATSTVTCHPHQLRQRPTAAFAAGDKPHHSPRLETAANMANAVSIRDGLTRGLAAPVPPDAGIVTGDYGENLLHVSAAERKP